MDHFHSNNFLLKKLNENILDYQKEFYILIGVLRNVNRIYFKKNRIFPILDGSKMIFFVKGQFF